MTDPVEQAALSMANQLAAMFPSRKAGKPCWKNRLREERKARKLTLRVVSMAVGCELGYLSQLELGKSLPGIDPAFRLARFYRVSAEHLWPPQVEEIT